MIENLRHIRAFLAIARIGNFTRAAVELRMSQSALTVQIKQLEEDFGTTLFDRGKRKVSLTQAGKDVLLPLERLLIDAEEVVNRTQQLSGLRRGLVSVAVLPSLATHLVPAAVKKFTSVYPDVTVQVRDLVADKVIEAVRSEEVDFGIGAQMRPDRELKSTVFLSDRMCVFLPAAHPLAATRTFTLQQVLGLTLILTGRDSSAREVVEKAAKRQGVTLRVAYETNYMSTALGMVEAGLGGAILPETAAGTNYSTSMRRIPIQKPELSRKIEFIERKGKSLSPAASQFMLLLRELALLPLSKPVGLRT